MLIRTMARGLALSTIAMPGAAWCLGLGDINVDTALNQPFRAEIKFLSVKPGDLDNLRASLASPETFERVGVERPFVLSQLQFKSTRSPDGQAILEVTTKEPVREPFLNFLVEVQWPEGRLLREYTVLLDPPVLMEQRNAASVQAASSANQARAGSNANAPAAVGAYESSGARLADVPVEYTVARGDTLYEIAEPYRPSDDVSLSQVMLAIQRANPDAFAHGNINSVLKGAVLRIPTGDALRVVDKRAAVAEVARQIDLWQDYRVQPSTSAVDDPTAGSTGLERTSEQSREEEAAVKGDQPFAEDGTQSATVPKQESRLRIMAAEERAADTQVASAGDPADQDALQTESAVARELAESRQVEIDALTSRLGELESIVRKQTRIILLQAKALTKLQQRLDAVYAVENKAPAPSVSQERASEPAAVASEAAPMADAEQQKASERAKNQAAQTGPKNSEPAITTAPDPQSAPPEIVTPTRSVGLIEALFANPAMLAGLGAGAILLLALIWVVVKRAASRRAETVDLATYPAENLAVVPVEAGTVPADSSKDEVPAPNANSQPTDQAEIMQDEAVAAIPANAAAAEKTSKQGPDAVNDDTLAEADVYIAYGLQQQAEDLLKEAVKSNPTNVDYRLKLLEVHYANKNVQGFETEAQALHQNLSGRTDGIWERVAAMGTELNARNPLFIGLAAGQADSVGAETDATAPALDTTDTTAEAAQYSAADSGEAGPPARDEISTNAPDDHVLEFDATDLEATTIVDVSVQAPVHTADSSEVALDIDLSDLNVQDDVEAGQPATQSTHVPLDDSALELDAEERLQFDASDDSGESDLLITEPEALDFSIDELPGTTMADTALDVDGGLDADESTGLSDENEVGTKLDLARAYLDMGDADGALSTLAEVLEEGDEEQRQTAEVLMRRIA